VSRAMKEEQETGGRSMISDWENERVMRTKRACALAVACCSNARHGHFLPSVCPRLDAAPQQ
jgi:hypothetical protein